MDPQRMRKGSMNWEMDAAINRNQLFIACHWWHGLLWPTIAFPLSWSSYGARQFGSYCQGLALENGAAPWRVDVRELLIYGPFLSLMAVPDPLPPCEIPSTVVIEELNDDEEVPSSVEGEDGYVVV